MSRRLGLLVVFAATWFFLVAGRLWYLQVNRHEHFLEKAQKQQNRVLELTPPRGTIVDRAGRELAVSVEVASVAADPAQIEDPEATARALAKVLGLDARELTADLDSQRGFVWVERKLDPPRAAAVEALGLRGVFRVSESKRYYPLHELAAQVLGYVGTDNEGLAGLEYGYDRVVAGTPGRRTVVRDARSGIVLQPHLEGASARPGQDLVLTLDATLQHIAERELAAAVNGRHAQRGTVVMMDPSTGAILAMASYPSFDPNRFLAFPEPVRRNPAVQDAYEPGSTFKMVTLAAALEVHAVDPLSAFDCEMGATTVAGKVIRDHKPFGVLTVREIIAKSSNVGAIKIGHRAGPEALYRTIEAFGFGRPTGVDLPGESSGILWPRERWTPRTPAYVSFGQGISVTALQLTNAFAAIANGGRLLRPYLVAATRRGEEERVVHQPELLGVPIAPSSVALIRDLLEEVVVEGTAESAALQGWRAAGKTGTAQKPVPGQGYAAGAHVASFVGFAPVERPAVVCAVILDDPRPHYHGGEVAAPVFREIVDQALLYLGVPPDRPREPPVPALQVAEMAPPAQEEAGEPAPPPPGTVPDFAGLSAREAVRRSSALGLVASLSGHGAVARQSPPPGAPLAAGERLELWLSPEAL